MEQSNLSPCSRGDERRTAHAWRILRQYLGDDVERYLRAEGVSLVALAAGEAYSEASSALSRLAINVDGWPTPPAGLFVVEERTVYLRAVDAMTVIHETGHAIDCALGGGIYRSSTDPAFRKAFNETRAFVTPYAAAGTDECFAEGIRALVEANIEASFWPRATRARLFKQSPQVARIVEDALIEARELGRRLQGVSALPDYLLGIDHRVRRWYWVDAASEAAAIAELARAAEDEPGLLLDEDANSEETVRYDGTEETCETTFDVSSIGDACEERERPAVSLLPQQCKCSTLPASERVTGHHPNCELWDAHASGESAPDVCPEHGEHNEDYCPGCVARREHAKTCPLAGAARELASYVLFDDALVDVDICPEYGPKVARMEALARELHDATDDGVPPYDAAALSPLIVDRVALKELARQVRALAPDSRLANGLANELLCYAAAEPGKVTVAVTVEQGVVEYTHSAPPGVELDLFIVDYDVFEDCAGGLDGKCSVAESTDGRSEEHAYMRAQHDRWLALRP